MQGTHICIHIPSRFDLASYPGPHAERGLPRFACGPGNEARFDPVLMYSDHSAPKHLHGCYTVMHVYTVFDVVTSRNYR